VGQQIALVEHGGSLADVCERLIDRMSSAPRSLGWIDLLHPAWRGKLDLFGLLVPLTMKLTTIDLQLRSASPEGGLF
jgi:hypothetical protein